jgi:putative mRNA 3-end processing factor
MQPEEWLKVMSQGLYCLPGNFFIDPVRPVAHAFITHGHSDHARPNNQAVVATPGTLAIMRARYGESAGTTQQAVEYGKMLTVSGVNITFIPAGHVLGSAQILLEYGGKRVIVSGDYKRRRDPTCELFKPIPCDVFITEATFALPVFQHPPDSTQIKKVLETLELYPERCVLIGAYALGKCQRIICLLREAGYHETIYLHGAVISLCNLYQELNINLGSVMPVAGIEKDALKGKIVLAPPSALHDRWSRRLPDPVTAFASGWMMIRARARQKLVELPLVISDHADWPELIQTLQDVGAPEVWVTHGREDALVYYANNILGIKARALDIHGYDEEED